MWRPSQSPSAQLTASTVWPPPELQLPQSHGHARAQPCASWVWTLTPTRWLVDVPACPHRQGGAQGWACPVCAPACPAPAWGGQATADGPCMATPGSPWHPQPRELPALQHPARFIGNLGFAFEALSVVILTLKRKKKCTFLIQEGKRELPEKHKCSLFNNSLTMDMAEVEICRNNIHTNHLFPVLISYPLFRMSILIGQSIYEHIHLSARWIGSNSIQTALSEPAYYIISVRFRKTWAILRLSYMVEEFVLVLRWMELTFLFTYQQVHLLSCSWLETPHKELGLKDWKAIMCVSIIFTFDFQPCIFFTDTQHLHLLFFVCPVYYTQCPPAMGWR